MSDITFVHHDINYVARLLERFDESTSRKERSGLAIAIVEQIRMEQWLSELRCLRERTKSPCRAMSVHTHAPDM